ncbi:MAG: hypothetical protein SH868_16045 [Bythopirellula sp.]|nr:hypothetical protein [Bythopirellula sp.]
MEQLIPLLIQLIGGGAGGNIAGTLLKNIDLSRLAQTIIGIVGGIAGGQAINWMGVLESVMGAGGAGGLLGNAGVSGAGGAILVAIVGLIKKAMAGGGAS